MQDNFDEYEKSLAWELNKDQSKIIKICIKALAFMFLILGLTVSSIVFCFLRYLSLYDFSSDTYENSSKIEASSEGGGDANAILNGG